MDFWIGYGIISVKGYDYEDQSATLLEQAQSTFSLSESISKSFEPYSHPSFHSPAPIENLNIAIQRFPPENVQRKLQTYVPSQQSHSPSRSPYPQYNPPSTHIPSPSPAPAPTTQQNTQQFYHNTPNSPQTSYSSESVPISSPISRDESESPAEQYTSQDTSDSQGTNSESVSRLFVNRESKEANGGMNQFILGLGITTAD